MATRAAHKRLTREYATLQKSPPEYITAHPSESNILEWHYILTGPPDTPYHNGQYWGTLTFPPDYPFAPPAIRMHTPSGRFRCSERLCLSISDFHPKSFNPAWEVGTILLGVLSFMTGEDVTTGSVTATDAERRGLAERTRWWNSTGGGSWVEEGKSGVNKGGKGFGAIKAGDGGRRFREEWPEVDEENWRWMKEEGVNVATGRRVSKGVDGTVEEEKSQKEGGTVVAEKREPAAIPEGFLARNKFYMIGGVLFLYVLAARLVKDQQQ
ncbi:ubiquitin-conjugating enzyme E2 like protein [Zymoseptoria brevis]|uniref:Ubiquitin-conjugating enzyme E2 like protein n=1 Tax=Zymoseptoria brevis TaxID=1047168 RepID=A0A0F4GAL1_9PEZI|nr:ubiquitin-conjugating enzyme E2 like protein [Zymoseptoria brevis]